MARVLSIWSLIVGSGLPRGSTGHGALVSPPSRNAFDGSLPRFADGRGSICACGNVTRGCEGGSRGEAMNGQPCLWFSQGCFIGCARCTGADQQPFGAPLGWENNCTRGDQPAGSTSQPTLPHRLWTMNRGAIESSPQDIFRFHPWRAPGSAPVTDACGTAGGTTPAHAGPGHATFSPVTNDGREIVLGDLGSAVLPRKPAADAWVAGDQVEVKWALRINHGGGYQYRLCPADEKLTEDCFQQNPLDFVREKAAIEFNNGSRVSISGQFVDEGIIPVGSTWARNPIPMILGARPECASAKNVNATDRSGMLCRQFHPPCADTEPWHQVLGSSDPSDVMGVCSGNWIGGVIVDTLQLPPDIRPGDYVLGFRWDCEQTSQVWSSCADVTIRAQ